MQRLPAIRIPLPDLPDDDVRLDFLQPLVDRCYAMHGRYEFDYRAVEPHPPLDAEDATLVDEWLRDKGLR